MVEPALEHRQQRFRREIHFEREAPYRTRAKILRVPMVQESSDANIPGISKVLNNKLPFWLRILWFLFSLGTFSICFYQIGERIKLYEEDVSSTETNYFTLKTIDFPSAVFCPYDTVVDHARVNNIYDHLMTKAKVDIYRIWNRTLIPNNFLMYLNKVDVTDLFNQSIMYTHYGACYIISPRNELEFKVSEVILRIHFLKTKLSRYQVMLAKREDLLIYYVLQERLNKMVFTRGGHECPLHITMVHTSFMLLWLPFMQGFEDFPLCTSWKEVVDMMSVIDNTSQSFNNALCLCPLKCSETMSKTPQCFSSEDEKCCALSLKLRGNKIPVTTERQRYRWYSLFCDVSGALGLWLGMSFMQILTIFKTNVSKYFSLIISHSRKTAHEFPKRRLYVFRENSQQVERNECCGFHLLCIRHAERKSYFWHKVPWVTLSAVVTMFGLYVCVIQVLFYMTQPIETHTRIAGSRTFPMTRITICLEPEVNILPAWQPPLSKDSYGRSLYFHEVLKLLENGTMTLTDIWEIPISIYTGKKHTQEFLTAVGTCITRRLDKFQENLQLKLEWKHTWEEYNNPNIRVIFHADDRLLSPYVPLIDGYMIPGSVSVNFITSFVEVTYDSCQPGNITEQCLQNCIEAKIFSECARPCRLPFMKNYEAIPDCLSKEDLNLIVNITLRVVRMINLENCNCPKICKEVMYKLWDVEEKNVYGGLLDIKFIAFEPAYQILEQYYTYSALDLFSDLGSALGFVLGTCALHAINATVDLLFKIMSACLNQFSSRKRQKEKNMELSTQIKKGDSNNIGLMKGCDVVVPGFENVLKKDSTVTFRVFWLTISLLALFGCIFQGIEKVIYFWSDPSAVITYNTVNQTLAYPMAVICPEERHSDQTFQNYIKDVEYLPLNSSIEDVWRNYKPFKTAVEVSFNTVPVDSVMYSEEDTMDGRCIVVRPTQQLTYYGKEDALFITLPTFKGFAFSMRPLLPPEDVLLISYKFNARRFKVIGFPDYLGSAVKAVLQVKEEIFRNTTDNPCEDGETVSKCTVDCIENKIYAKSADPCRLPFMQKRTSFPTCKTVEQMKRIYNLALTFQEEFMTSGEKICSCPKKCRKLWYWFQLKVTPDLGKPIAIVRIPDNTVSVMEEIPSYSLFKMFSDIGGVLGLYFAFGLLQILEIIEACIFKLVLK